MKLEEGKIYRTAQGDKAIAVDVQDDRVMVFCHDVSSTVYYTHDGEVQDSRYNHLKSEYKIVAELDDAPLRKGELYLNIIDVGEGLAFRVSSKNEPDDNTIAVKHIKWVEGDEV